MLDAVVADVVFTKFDTKKEGFLTNTRSKIVQRETLNKLALQLGLDKLVKSSTRTVSHNNYMYGNAFEAFIGAIYVDQGYDACKHFIEERVIAPYINIEKLARKEVNFKSKLIEWSQKNKVKISFDLIESFNDQDNNPIFQTQVTVCGIAGGIGTGYSKKESQQNAAKATMKKIQSDQAFRAELDAAKAALKKAKKDAEKAANAEAEAVATDIEAVATDVAAVATAIAAAKTATAKATTEVAEPEPTEEILNATEATEPELTVDEAEPSEEVLEEAEAAEPGDADFDEEDADEPEEEAEEADEAVEEAEEETVSAEESTEAGETEEPVDEAEPSDEALEEAEAAEPGDADFDEATADESEEEAEESDKATDEAGEEAEESDEATQEPKAIASMLQGLIEKKSEEESHKA